MTRDDQHELDHTLAAPLEADATQAEPGSRSSWHGAPSSRYRLEAELGRGGMGEVVSARDDQIGRLVAIKRLRSTSTPETEARFLREARIQGRLDHPAIVPVHELGRDDRGQPFFAMKQLTGKTLAEVIAQPTGERTFTRNQLLRALIDVCLAVHFAHERGVVHRDLKPSNIMLGNYGEVYVLDWGIARVLAEVEGNRFGDIDTFGEGQTLAGQLLGTPGYMSPEQVQGDEIDARTDVFALGCILFEVLVGQPLLPRGNAALAATIAGAADVRAKRGDVEIAPELEQACIAATALERGDRLASARTLADLIQGYLDGDRDVSLRRKLAASELATANEALARGDTVADRRIALRAASRALALAPEARAPADLVGRLMIEPPATVPPEVDAEVEAIERKALIHTSTQGNRALFAVLAFVPVLYAGGIDELWYMVMLPILALIVWIGTWLQTHRDWQRGVHVSMVANMVIVGVFSRLASPFLVAPALGILIATLFVIHRASGRAWIVGAGFGLAILLPWFLELAGVLSPTMRFTATEIVIDPSGGHVEPRVLLPMLGIYVAVTIGVAMKMSRSLAWVHHESQRQLQLQAWQLRQLVPESR